MRKHLLKLLESWIYPEGTTSTTWIYQDDDGTYVAVNREDMQREFEKLLAEISRD